MIFAVAACLAVDAIPHAHAALLNAGSSDRLPSASFTALLGQAWSFASGGGLIRTLASHEFLIVAGLLVAGVFAALVHWLYDGLRLTRRAKRMDEERFSVLLESLSQGVATFDRDGRLVYANANYFALYRLDPAALPPGTHMIALLEARRASGTFDEDTRAYLKRMADAARTNRIARIITPIPDGRYMAVSRAPLPDGGWVTTHEDVSERARLRADAQLAKEFLRSIVDHVPIGLAVYDVEFDKFALVNAAGAAFFEKSEEQIIGFTPEEVMGKEAAVRIRALNAKAVASGGRTVVHEFQPVHLKQRMRVLSRRAAVNGADGTPRYVVTTLEDVTQMRDLTEQVEKSRRFLENIIDSLPIAVVVKSVKDLRYHVVNEAFEELTGRSRMSVIGQAPSEFYASDSAATVESLDRRIAAGDASAADTQTDFEKADGTVIKLQTRRNVLLDAEGNPEYIIAMFEDVTEQHRIAESVRESKKFLENVIDQVPIAVLVKNAEDGRYLLCNREAEKIVGINRGDVVGQNVEGFAQNQTIRDVVARDRIAMNSPGHVFTAEVPLVRDGDAPGLMLTRRVAVASETGEARYIVATYDDITDRRQNESRLAYLAYHDALTRLPNRSAFIHSLEQMIDSCASIGERFSVLSIDLDRFKEINDVCGHQIGDKLLEEVARRLQSAAEGAVVARLSGDEFGLIVDGEQPEAGRKLAQRLIEIMKDEFVLDDQALRCSLTCGVAVFPNDGSDAASLLANADAALHRAKSDARGSLRFFEAEMDQQLRRRRALHHELGSAIKNHELLLHYQPQTVPGGMIIGFESLVRWQHPVRGMVSPADFIPVAEESGLIVEMGEWILREACREAATWTKAQQIAVNLSPIQFQHGDLVNLVHSILLETGLPPSRLELEITEGVLIRDFDRSLSLLRRLKALGVKIAMDDFGSGYSSLAYLQAFPFDKIKIDREFVINLGRNHQSAAIIRAVIGLGHGLGVPIVAEGVETQEQLAFLVQEGCDQFQGYYLGKPAPIMVYAEEVGLPKPRPTPVSRAS